MMSLRQYQHGDLQLIPPREYEQKFRDFFGYATLEARCIPETSYTLCKNGKPIGAAGLYQYWPGTAEVWLYLSEEALKYPILLVSDLREGLAIQADKLGIKRFQTLIDARIETNQRFIEALGFTLESRLVKYGPWGEDNLMYVKFVE